MEERRLEDVARAHVESFDYMVEYGLSRCVPNIRPSLITPSEVPGLGEEIKLCVTELKILPATDENSEKVDSRCFPSESRQRFTTYGGVLVATVRVSVGAVNFSFQKSMGKVPVMVRSRLCSLNGLSERERVSRGEEPTDPGGYFIVNGLERLMRLIIIRRRNVVVCENRTSFMKHDRLFTTFGTTIRCVRDDEVGRENRLNYQKDGGSKFSFFLRMRQFFLPPALVLHALVDCSDREIFDNLVQERFDNYFLVSRAEILLKYGCDDNDFPSSGTRFQSVSYLGKMFRSLFGSPEEVTDFAVGEMLLEEHVFIHCKTNREKFNLLIFMLRKVYALAEGTIEADSIDTLQYQESVLPGHLYLNLVYSEVNVMLRTVRRVIITELTKDPEMNIRDKSTMRKLVDKSHKNCKINTFMATGNIPQLCQGQVELAQYSGWTITAERLNHLRFLSHFVSIHRGSFFLELRTTAVRKLLPESWGFLCPVHTPDGGPCGLLNHLAMDCRILTGYENPNRDVASLVKSLVGIGMSTLETNIAVPSTYIPVILDGVVIGNLHPGVAETFGDKLRYLKAKQIVSEWLEIISITSLKHKLFPSVMLSLSYGRFVRKVTHAPSKNPEWISPFEQIFLDIAIYARESSAATTHFEISPVRMLNMLSACTPFSDFNQSPRNMYQCQMAKQTMGTPFLSLPYRTDNKAYRLQTPQIPLVRNEAHDAFELGDYPVGMNAIVAVISYTGYDMEDAMIVNRSSYQRGLAHGSVYLTIKEDLSTLPRTTKRAFCNIWPQTGKPIEGRLGPEGVVKIGDAVKKGDPLYCVLDLKTGEKFVAKHKYEPAIVESVTFVVGDDLERPKLVLKLRLNRNPVIGDKFSSRHGQKGVLSQLWPSVDMPFSESGMSPDIIINPHAFPSRMTIGMLIESMAGKSACLNGTTVDSTPFQYSEDNRAIDEFGKQLVEKGYNYLGNEPLYSGVSGELLEADIFIGNVYYQRLRHMVSDKSQVRSTGVIDKLTKQPLKVCDSHICLFTYIVFRGGSVEVEFALEKWSAMH